MRLSCLPLLALLVASCGGSVEGDGPVRSQSSRFVGLWNVHHLRALVDETFYRFEPDGSLRAGSSRCSDAQKNPCVTGEVTSCSASRSSVFCQPTTCSFGDRWFSEGESILAIEGTCSDGVARTIRFELTNDPSLNTTGTETRLHSVGGDPSWVVSPWPIGFVKCSSDTEASCPW